MGLHFLLYPKPKFRISEWVPPFLEFALQTNRKEATEPLRVAF